jgi:hypothetical protein
MKQVLAAAAITAALSGCALPIGQQALTRYHTNCVNFGFAPGAPDFANCMQHEHLAYLHAAAITSLGQGFTAMGMR